MKQPAPSLERKAKTTASKSELISEAEELFNSGANEEVLDRCDQYIELNPEYARVWVLKGASLVRLENYGEALLCYDRALQIDSEDANVWTDMGVALFHIERYRNSVECSSDSAIVPSHPRDRTTGITAPATRNHGTRNSLVGFIMYAPS